MAHEIFGERIMSREQVPWHKLGDVFDDYPTATEAADRAGLLDYEVRKLPIGVNVPEAWLVMLAEDASSEFHDDFVIARSPTSDDPQVRIFGHVGEKYEVLPNQVLAEILDPLTEEWPVETAAVLRNGEHVFLTLYAGDTEVNGDQLREYFFITTDHSGNEGVRLGYSPVRMVCMNTLQAGTSQATEMVTLSHAGDIKDKVEFHTKLFAALRDIRSETLDFFDTMGDTVLEGDEIDDVLHAAWPDPNMWPQVERYRELVAHDGDERLERIIEEHPDRWERLQIANKKYLGRKRRAEQRRAGALERLAYWNDENDGPANSAWNVWGGAITEVTDWREGRGNIAQQVIRGNRAKAKQRAFGKIVDIVVSKN